MHFFKRLGEEAFKPYLEDEGYTVFERAGIIGVIDATIEALKEMMVGEPMDRRLVHTAGGTYFEEVPRAEVGMRMIEGVIDRRKQHSTDGEEVTAIIFRVVPKEERCLNSR